MGGKLRVGETLGEAFSLYGAQARVLLPLAFCVYLPGAIIGGLNHGSFGMFVGGVLVDFAAAAIYQGMVVGLVRRVHEGRDDLTTVEIARSVVPMMLPLFGAGVLSGLGFLAGITLFIAPGLFLLTIWAVVAPVIVIERTGLIDAFRRSRRLVEGSGWKVFGAVLTAFVLATAAGIALARTLNSVTDGPLPWMLSSAGASTVTAPVTALVAAVLYFRLLEIEHTRLL